MSRHNRTHRQAVAVKARRPPPGGTTFTTDQLAAILSAQGKLAMGSVPARPLPRPPQWASDPFGPGFPLPPAPINLPRPDTGRAEPRLFEYPVSTNLQIHDRVHVPWKVLQEAADMPLFRKCIKRRKGVCQLGFVVTVDPQAVAREAALSSQADKDVEKALRAKYMPEIIRITDWLAMPDRGNGYDWVKWTSLLMENMLKFDATVIYPRRTYGGDVFSFEVIDGKTIKPLMDERGGRPMPPNPAFQQILYGFPRGEFVADAELDASGKLVVAGGYPSDQIIYERRELRSETPYGMSDTEIALLDGLLWMRRMGWLMAEYSEGVTPASVLKTSNEIEWSVKQWEDWNRAINDHLGGNTAERHKFQLFPPGVEPMLLAEVAERYKPEMDMFMIKLIAGDFGLTATELGFPEVGSLGASFHEGEEDVLNRVTRIPDANWLAGIATNLAVKQLGMPGDLMVQILGLESEDEAAADAVALSQVQSGRLTLNEDRERRGLTPYDFDEANMPMIEASRGIVFIENASKAAPPGVLIGPAMAPPTSTPPGGPGDGPEGEPAPGQQAAAQASKAVRTAAGKLGQAASDAAALARSLAPGDEDDGPRPGSVAAELAAYHRWVRKGAQRGAFTCKAIARADAPPQMAADGRVVFKGDAPGPKALAGRGLAGTGTAS